MKKIIVIGGPTGVGKTAISVKIAKEINGEIINADASQFVRRLNIGTSKITDKEMCGIKHHLLDIVDIGDDYSIYDYQRDARRIIDEIINRGNIPIIVGGSGLYIQALIYDYKLDNKKSNHDLINEKYKEYDNESLYKLLQDKNPVLASKTHANNRNRVLRYLEMDVVSNEKPLLLYDCMYLCMTKDRKLLYDNINNRTIKMFNDGWLQEVQGLIDQGIDFSLIKSIGYKDILDYINNNISYDELISNIQKETRHYAKRQFTWFNNQTDALKIDVDNYDYNELLTIIKTFLGD